MSTTTMHSGITEGSIPKQLLLFFFPILMGSFFQQMYNTVDTVIVGRAVGTQALAAVGSTGSLLNLINGFFIGISSGATVILSQSYGAGDRAAVERALHTGITLSVVLGAVIMVCGVGAARWMLTVMQTPESCLDLAIVYIRVIFCGAIGSMVYNMGAGILRAMGDSRRPMLYLIVSCFVNIGLDILLVVIFRLGVAGAALATILSQFVSAALLLRCLFRRRDFTLKLRSMGIHLPLMRRILAIGMPAGLQFVTFDLSNILVQACINSFGDVTMAAWTAYCKTDAMTWLISGAFGVSVTTFVGQNFGAQQYKRIRRSVWTAMGMAVPIMGLLSLVIVLFRFQILSIYSADPEVVRVGAQIVTYISPFALLFMPVEIFAATMRGTGYSVMPTVITCTSVCVFRVIWVATVVAKWHTLFALCICYPISWFLAAVVFAIAYFRGSWLRERILACGMEPEC